MGESYVNNVKATSRSHVKKISKLNVTEKDSLNVYDAKRLYRSDSGFALVLAGLSNRDTKLFDFFERDLISISGAEKES